MAVRVQVIMEEQEREAFRHVAAREGLSLSAWFRQVAKEKLLARDGRKPITGVKELRRFFRECDRQGKGREPDWEEHLKVIEQSIASGRAAT